jgi:cell division protein FtsW (lipid II flippase)
MAARRGAVAVLAVLAVLVVSAQADRHKKWSKHRRHERASFWGHDVEDAVSQVHLMRGIIYLKAGGWWGRGEGYTCLRQSPRKRRV